MAGEVKNDPLTKLHGKTWELACDYEGFPEGTRFTSNKETFDPLTSSSRTGIYVVIDGETEERFWNKPGLLIREAI